jgi:hypothetical protein
MAGSLPSNDRASSDLDKAPEAIDSSKNTPAMGGGMPLVQYWAEKTLSPKGPQSWKALTHKSACLSCAWGTGGRREAL